MELELNIFNKKELIRACQLVGYKNKDNCLDGYTVKKLNSMIMEKVNPKGDYLRNQYLKALKLFKIVHGSTSDDKLRKILYDHSKKQLEKALKKLSKKKKEILAKQLEDSLDPTILEKLKKKGKLGVAVGGGILLIHGGAIAITSINLGICFLLTSGLSVISGILGITFPFAAYTTAAVVGGYIIQAGGFLASPVTAIPLLGIATFLIYKKIHNKQFINLAGINYIIETKKILEI